MTNADRIREMSDEELAEFLNCVEEYGISSQYIDVPCDCCCEKTACDECWKEWLQSEAEQEEKDMQCNGTCKYLNERKHKCELTGEKLSYMKQTGSLSFTVHEHRGICKGDRDNGRQIFIQGKES